MSTDLTALSSEEMLLLFKSDPQHLKNAFRQLLRTHSIHEGIMSFSGDELVEMPLLDPAHVARVFRVTGESLDYFGIYPMHDDESTENLQLVNRIGECMDKAHGDDALLLFIVLAESSKNCPMEHCLNLMTFAFENPGFGTRAIEAVPAFFLKQADGDKKGNNPANAYQVLARSGLYTDCKISETAELVQILGKLQQAGARDDASKIDSSKCLHVAACYQSERLLNVFLSQFSDDIDARDALGRQPLFYAAASKFPGNIKILIDAGAAPLVRDNGGYTPLHFACELGRIENALALLATGLYPDEYVHNAAMFFNDAEKSARLRAAHAALKAADTIGGLASGKESSFRPL